MARKSTPASATQRRPASSTAVASAPDEPTPPKPDWSRRWATIRAVLLFCAGLGLYIVVAGPSDRLRESAFLGLLALAGSVVLGYLGFATQDDRHWLQSLPQAQDRAQDRAREGRR